MQRYLISSASVKSPLNLIWRTDIVINPIADFSTILTKRRLFRFNHDLFNDEMLSIGKLVNYISSSDSNLMSIMNSCFISLLNSNNKFRLLPHLLEHLPPLSAYPVTICFDTGQTLSWYIMVGSTRGDLLLCYWNLNLFNDASQFNSKFVVQRCLLHAAWFKLCILLNNERYYESSPDY